jgi:hypothetical protein
MAYDQEKRMNGEQKEERGDQTKALGQPDNDKIVNSQVGSEFAADSWMGGMFQPLESKSREDITYDPNTQTERYRGNDQLDGETPVPPLTSNVTDFNPFVKVEHRGDKRSSYETEAATEIAPPVSPRSIGRSDGDSNAARSPVTISEETTGGTGIGVIGLGLSILSLFTLPYVIAPIGMIMGYLAFRREARTLGAWAMAVGAVAILGAVLIYPYFVVT